MLVALSISKHKKTLKINNNPLALPLTRHTGSWRVYG